MKSVVGNHEIDGTPAEFAELLALLGNSSKPLKVVKTPKVKATGTFKKKKSKAREAYFAEVNALMTKTGKTFREAQAVIKEKNNKEKAKTNKKW